MSKDNAKRGLTQGNKSHKKRNIIIAIVVLILLLLLLLLLWFIIRHTITRFESPPTGYSENYSYNETFNTEKSDTTPQYSPEEPDYIPPQTSPQTREYKTSSTLSKITFSKAADMVEEDITWKESIDITLTGYLQEIDPATSKINNIFDRVYIFKDSKVDWDISGSERKESEYCLFVYSSVGKGSSPIEGLNVDTGDTKLSMKPVEGWGSWALTYTENGFSSWTPEIALEGHVLFPMVETVTTTRLTENSICGDYETMGPVKTRNFVINPTFPLKLLNVNLDQNNYAGSLEAEEDAFDSPEGATATFENAMLTLPIDIPEEAEKWQVTWDINLPN